MSETEPETFVGPDEVIIVNPELHIFPGRFGLFKDDGIPRIAMVVENPEGPGVHICVFEATHKDVPVDMDNAEGTFKPV